MSCPHAPEQNGVGKRKHRHLVKTGLTLLFNTGVPLFLWVEAFMTASYLINRLPTLVLKMCSPLQKLYNKIPDYGGLKILVVDKGYNNKKFQPKTFPCIFIGYSTLHKGYMCYHPQTKRIGLYIQTCDIWWTILTFCFKCSTGYYYMSKLSYDYLQWIRWTKRRHQ